MYVVIWTKQENYTATFRFQYFTVNYVKFISVCCPDCTIIVHYYVLCNSTNNTTVFHMWQERQKVKQSPNLVQPCVILHITCSYEVVISKFCITLILCVSSVMLFAELKHFSYGSNQKYFCNNFFHVMLILNMSQILRCASIDNASKIVMYQEVGIYKHTKQDYLKDQGLWYMLDVSFRWSKVSDQFLPWYRV